MLESFYGDLSHRHKECFVPPHPLQSVIDAQPNYLKNLTSGEEFTVLVKDPNFDPREVEKFEEIPVTATVGTPEIGTLLKEGWRCLAFILYHDDDRDRLKVYMAKMKAPAHHQSEDEHEFSIRGERKGFMHV